MIPIPMNASRNLEDFSFANTFVLTRFRLIYEVGTVTHQVLSATIAASTNCNARVFVCEKLKSIVATIAFDVSEVVNRIRIPTAVAGQFDTNVLVIFAVPVFTTFYERHWLFPEMPN
ncbi:MAG: hypothetical protein R3C28_00895 [Pirellulaceae bacterium]